MTSYVELHAHSNFSLLDGASAVDELVACAASLGMPALGLTDHNSVYAAVPFMNVADTYGIKPIFGAEITLETDAHITLLVRNAVGWRNLCALITTARHNAPKGEASLPKGQLLDHAEGLVVLSGCGQGTIPSLLRAGQTQKAQRATHALIDAFGQENVWIEIQNHLLPYQAALNKQLVDLARATGVAVVATNNVHYAKQDQHILQDVLVSIRHNTPLEDTTHLRRHNSEYYLKSAVQMKQLFADYPQAIENTLVVATLCDFQLAFGLQDLPIFQTPDNGNPEMYLRHICEQRLEHKYARVTAKVKDQLTYELTVIENAGLSNYFLIVWDIVRFSRENHILCQGRGSAANSLVAYLLDITSIDPLQYDLVFERFLSNERQVVPDIDIDFQADRREEVIQYVYNQYGHDHTAMACTYITYRTRSSIRDVGKALNLPPTLVDQLAKSNDRHNNVLENDAVTDIGIWHHFTHLCTQIRTFPRHLSIHNGGMVISKAPLSERIPIEPATMPDRSVVQWDKNGLEIAGIVKIDILGLRMLSAIAEAVDHIAVTTGSRPELDQLSFDDPAIYKMITAADTIGVFQVESRAQQQVLPRLKPTCFNDLIVSISLIRPGPIIGDMVHPYLRRRSGEEAIEMLHPTLETALEETLGVILFQEQVLKVARDLAGFSAGQGERLRRALGNKYAHEVIETFRDDFIQGALNNGVSEDTAIMVFEKLQAFGSYSFPKSHAAAFSVLVYQSAWLKHYHTAAFTTAILNHQPMGFWHPNVIINDAKRHGIKMLSVDIHRSNVKCKTDGERIRLGLTYVKNIGTTAAERIVQARDEHLFTDLRDFCKRTRLPPQLIENLIRAGALDSWHQSRRKLLWNLGRIKYPIDELDLEYPNDNVRLREETPVDRLTGEYEMMGLSVHQHPVALFRKRLNKAGFFNSRTIQRLASTTYVTVAGMQVVRQMPPTAKGVVFVTLEDEWGFLNIIVRPNIYEQCRPVIQQKTLLVVHGTVQSKDGAMNVIAHWIE